MFEDTIILFESFNEPLNPIGNNTPTIETEVNFDLDNNQKFDFARIFTQVCGGSITGLAYRVEFNGKTLGSQVWGPLENGCKSLDVPVTDIIKEGKNILKIHLDGRLSNQDVTLYADLFYSLNTQEGPNKVKTSDPEKEDFTKNIITAAIIVSGIVTVGVVAASLLKGRRFKI